MTIPGSRFIFLIWDRILTIYLTVNNAVPSIRQMAYQFIPYIRYVQRNRPRHDHGTGIIRHPKLMDDSSHQAQNATGTLKAFQRCPISIQPVKNLGMNRVAGYHTVPILHFLSLHRKIRGILLIHTAESVADHISGIRIFTVEEQSTAYNFKALICCNRLPDRFHSSKCMLDSFQRRLTSVTANFNI